MHTSLFTAAFITLTAVAVSAQTAFTFEADLTGWTTVGNAAIESVDTFGVAATQGNQYLVLDTGARVVGMDAFGTPSADPLGTSGDDLLPFVGMGKVELDTLSGNDTSEVALASIDVFLRAGDTLTFDYKFLTDEFPGTGFNDFAFFAVSSGEASVLADVDSSSFKFFADAIVANEADWMQGSYTATDAGTYTFVFGVADVNGTDFASMLALDNLAVVPEASASSLLAGLAVALVAVRRRRA